MVDILLCGTVPRVGSVCAGPVSASPVGRANSISLVAELLVVFGGAGRAVTDWTREMDSNYGPRLVAGITQEPLDGMCGFAPVGG